MTLATDFVPGSNRKGKVTGANWLFLLPNLELERVICLGAPSTSTLAMLATLSHHVTLIGGPDVADPPGPDGIERLAFDGDGALPLRNGCADLLVLAGEDSVARFNTHAAMRAELLRLLAPDGIAYAEGRDHPVLRGGAADSTVSGAASAFWLTPLQGEMHTAVPVDDLATITYFLQNNLTSPMLNLSGRVFKYARRFAPARKSPTAVAATTAGSQNGHSGSKPAGARRPSLKRSMRRVGLGLMDAARRVEGLVDQKRLVRRYGMLYGGPASETSARPPRYLREIARASGISLDTFRWGLSARGEYSSRKLLFFLFDRAATRKDRPDYIVKMVRDASFNYRLDNEARSLKILAEKGFSDPGALPQVVFAGHHAGLSLVGESIVTGVPFRQASQATADCPYGRAALDWFVELGALTADPHAATSGAIAASLTQLLDRFVAIYRPTAEQQAFLAQQIAAIGRSATAVPLVFQHGDPGPWNMLVTPEGRVAVLDWEAAEPAGMPLWDLFYFMRSYSLDAARKQGLNQRLAAFSQQFLEDTPLSRLYVDVIERYCRSIGLDRGLIEPLFYTCWMHRALKESMRLDPAKLGHGHFANLIWWCRERQDAPTLQRLFAQPAVPVF